MPQNMTHNGVAAGKHDRENEGAVTVVYDEYTLNDYDPDSDGSGNDFDVKSEYGFSRLMSVDVQVVDSQAYVAAFDIDNQIVRLYALDGTGEVGNSTTVNVDLRFEIRGMGP
jgi:hypothetical protein